MLNNIEFEYPLLFLLVPFFVFCTIYCKARTPSYLIPHLHIYNKTNTKSHFIYKILKYLIGLFSITALASPVVIKQHPSIKSIKEEIINKIDAKDTLDLLPNSQILQYNITQKEYLFFYPLFFATILLILYIFIKNKE